MNIDGRNTLACTKAIEDIAGDVKVYPLPHMAVIKDLVTDFSHFFAQYEAIEPWLQTDTPPPEREWRQAPEDRARLNGAVRMHPVRLLLDRVPELLVEPGAVPRAGRPAAGPALAHADSRDERAGERLDGSRIRSSCTAATPS